MQSFLKFILLLLNGKADYISWGFPVTEIISTKQQSYLLFGHENEIGTNLRVGEFLEQKEKNK